MLGSARNRFAHAPANPDPNLARARGAEQPPQARAPQTSPDSQYAFLRQAGVSAATLAIAEAEARQCGAATHEVLLAAGLMSQTVYASALAGKLGVPVAGWDALFDPEAGDADDTGTRGFPALVDGRPHRVLCAQADAPDAVKNRVEALQAGGTRVALCSRFRLDSALEGALRPERLDSAVAGLFRRHPAASAAGPVWVWQVIAAAVAVGVVIGGLSIIPHATMVTLSAMMALPFLCVTLLRTVALIEIIASRREVSSELQTDPAILPPETLPVYSVLVPLLREANVLPGLVQSLQALVYPKAKLEILLVLEAVDIDTQAAVLAMRLPGNFRIVVVPDEGPRTKPKALNYALQVARGDYIVVYDAEDRPEPDQLLRALAVFRRHACRLGCVQAQLNVYNPRASWFTRQFAIEYSALFDAVLPALARLGLPVPLGGTWRSSRPAAGTRSM